MSIKELVAKIKSGEVKSYDVVKSYVDTINKKERKTGRECAAMENQRDFCTECRRETNYTLKKIKINRTIREKEYTFEITAAFCNKCGGEMG